jgi:DNA-binding response OmpR family regulator/DNA-directed RNA polymerase subunit RPC12/RpoP
MSTTIYFCPHCNRNHPTFEHYEEARLVVRCQRCGFPVEEGLVEQGGVAFQRTKILVVDDDGVLLASLSSLLAAHGFQPLTATDGPSGMEVAKRERPELILLDILMPGLDGLEACRRLRTDAHLKEVPIIIMTAMEDPKLNVKAFKAGATLALQKPLEPRRLIGTVKTALALKPMAPTTGVR